MSEHVGLVSEIADVGYAEVVTRVRDRLALRYARTWDRAWFRLFGHRIDERFAIIGAARTGSNYLMQGLQTSPCVRMYHEIFAEHSRTPGKNFEKIMSTVFQYESQATQVVGLKVFYYHLTDEEWRKFVAYRDFKIVHLTRWNRLRTLISREIALKTGQWTSRERAAAGRDKRVTLEPDTLMRSLERIEAGEKLTRQRFHDRPILEVVYEEVVRNPGEVFAAVGAYLGVDGIDPAAIKLRKQNPEPLQHLLANYDEVRAALTKSKYEEYLRADAPGTAV